VRDVDFARGPKNEEEEGDEREDEPARHFKQRQAK